ncbi:MAG: DNA-directed RNA polymerase subunit beta' [Lachnospiraceae bacterium]|nr:DNA-directed RNA polymerase subunit beta' [Lachnospiraceae bacterium]
MPETYKKEEPKKQLNFDAIRIRLASPEKIREWSHGEVKKPETINYRTLKPEKDGLFCERIFGPVKDWECHCGKYKKIRYKGVICDKCGVEVTKASVRRERMGHIELATPVSHIWYFKGIPSRMGLILDLSPRTLERVLYFASYIVLDPGETTLDKKQVLTEQEYQNAVEEFGSNAFRVGMGAEAIKELLCEIDLQAEYDKLREELETASGQKKARIIKRLEVFEAFLDSGNRPEWMILDCIPVIPPDLRPMVQLDGGRFATSDLNDLYRRIINRNNRLKRLLDLGAPDIIVRNEKRMLQEAVDALIDNGRRGRPVTGPGNRALKSLSDMLKGKSGRFRQNLLGKRVDYSGRSVIVNGPELKIYQCGLPKEMALELFKPFVMKELVSRQIANNIKAAKKMVEKMDSQVWDVLEDVIKEHPVMLNRAPTLHRLGIQAFEPVLVEGKAIKLHPLVCTAFNADFDGDQMAVHLPLTAEAQAECRFMLLSPNNLLKPSDGGIVAVPSQDMVLGIYYLTQERKGAVGEGTFYKDLDEAILAYENGYVKYQSRIKVRRYGKDAQGNDISAVIESTLGRFIFNEVIPQDLGYVDRTVPGNELVPEIDFMVKKGDLKKILQKVMDLHGATVTAEVLDHVKAMGYHISTRAGMTVSIEDMVVPESKETLIEEAEKKVDAINQNFKFGLVDEKGRYKEVIETWTDMGSKLEKAVKDNLDQYNNIFMMADSGARGSDKQILQLAGWRGLMADTTGKTIELPVKSNFREGLDVLEYFMSAHGARKGLSDTALRTADSGYLTRRMVDVSQTLMIREPDCSANRKEIPGMWVEEITDGKRVIETLQERINGRFSCYEIKDKDGNVIVKANHMITPSRAQKITTIGVDEDGNPITRVKVRTILTCRSKMGICSKCYGSNMATGEVVQVGEAVGTIAAQSIGEPGTQLTMRNFHTGGVAGGNDITQGLPRVEELFEARKPKGLAIITEIKGVARLQDTKKKREVVVTNDETGDSRTYLIPFGTRLTKKIEENADGVSLEAGDPITEGSINPHDLLKVKGPEAVQDYLLSEVQKTYRQQGVDICDKHIEVIVRQMLRKARVDDPGDTNFMTGRMVDYLDILDANDEAEEEGKKPATFERILLGITKASLATDSFLSAASFQETTRVLTDAAIKGKVDHLVGLKENVIIGKLIPAGTGMKYYRNLKLNTDEEFEAKKAAEEAAARAEDEEEITVDDTPEEDTVEESVDQSLLSDDVADNNEELTFDESDEDSEQ